MSEEIMAAIGTIAYWQRRAEQAEAGAAMLRRAVEACEAMIEWDDPAFPAAARRLRAAIDEALGQDAGAAILAELAAGQALAIAVEHFHVMNRASEVNRNYAADLAAAAYVLGRCLAAYRAAQHRT